jgi:hypothetical protein
MSSLISSCSCLCSSRPSLAYTHLPPLKSNRKGPLRQGTHILCQHRQQDELACSHTSALLL